LVGVAVLKHEDDDLTREQVACIITFLVGGFLFLLGLLRVGFLDNVLSKPLLCGFINAVALTIVIEQLDPLFGLKGDISMTLFGQLNSNPSNKWIDSEARMGQIVGLV